MTRVGNVSDTCQKVFRHVSKDAVMAKTEKKLMLFGKQMLLYADVCRIYKPFTVFCCLSKDYVYVKGL